MRRKLFDIKFSNWVIKNIEDFIDRDPNNTRNLDETIVETINYFLSKWTFIFCFNPYINKEQKELIKINLETIKYLQEYKWTKLNLSVKNLNNSELMENLHICTIWELASQQHSYLQKDRDVEVGIYIEEKNRIWWISTWELIQYMNLWKKKDQEFYVTP